MKTIHEIEKELIGLGYISYDDNNLGYLQYMIVLDTVYFHLIPRSGFNVWGFSFHGGVLFSHWRDSTPLDVQDVASAILLYGNLRS